ncbi:MAG: iron chelate uptake ABC transporter family permease subunit [Gammaproteobacteria bacterium]|jgi:iron complex transport system permease protein|nr:iron chelate uptake ABC transporter family permease subunit [Gammaproteobacteria bacterium]
MDALQLRIVASLAALLAMSLFAGFSVGALPVPWLDLLQDRADAMVATVLMEIRLPRVLLAGAVGAALGLAGGVLQGLFRNPLADPQLIGISGGAALGAVGMIVLGPMLALPPALAAFALPGAAFLGAVTVTASLFVLGSRQGELGVARMLLVGIAINALSGVGIGAFTYLSDDAQLRTLTFWTMGSFGSATWQTLVPALSLILVAGTGLLLVPRQLDLLQLGEVEARRLGVSLPGLKRRLVVCAAAAVGAGVALSGIIGFVGLVVPHLVRMLGGVNHAYLLPAAALLGAGLMIVADLLARTLVAPAEVPVGLITSAIGGPFFLWLIVRMRRA